MLTAKTTIFLSLGSRERKWGVEWKSISFISLQESLLQFKLRLIYTVSLSLKCDHQDWLRDDKIENGGVKTIHFFGLSDGGMFLSKNSSFIMMKLQMYTKDCRHDEPDSSNIYFAANWLGCFAPLFLSSVLVLTSKQVNIFLWVLLFYRNKSNSSLYWNAAIGNDKNRQSTLHPTTNKCCNVCWHFQPIRVREVSLEPLDLNSQWSFFLHQRWQILEIHHQSWSKLAFFLGSIQHHVHSKHH